MIVLIDIKLTSFSDVFIRKVVKRVFSSVMQNKKKSKETLYVVMLVSQRSHNYVFLVKRMYQLFFKKPCRLSGIRATPFRGTLMTVTITILQETGSRSCGDIYKNISQQRKTL